MNIGIIVAMDKELSLLLPLIKNVTETTINGFTFHDGTLENHHVTVVRCGIGKVNAAIGTMTLLDGFHPSLVINTGVAGGTGVTDILDIVVADRIAYHDVWCGPETLLGQAAGCPPAFVSDIEPHVLQGLKVKRGLIASGDVFVADAGTVNRILDLYPEALAVDMESAAIAHVCHVKGVPFMCIRVISDTPGAADNISQYENFWSDAPAHTFDVLRSILKRL